MNKTKQCKFCRGIFSRNPKFSDKQWGKTAFCSLKCFANSPQGIQKSRRAGISNKGRVHTEISRKNMSKGRVGLKLSGDHKHNISVSNKIVLSDPCVRLRMSIANKGKFISKETRKKLSELRKGDKNYNWKGNTASYSSKHKWLSKWVDKKNICTDCGSVGVKTDWSNNDGLYRRDPNNYSERCRSCHARYDKILRRQGDKPVDNPNYQE